jgi:hypothetical protein
MEVSLANLSATRTRGMLKAQLAPSKYNIRRKRRKPSLRLVEKRRTLLSVIGTTD